MPLPCTPHFAPGRADSQSRQRTAIVLCNLGTPEAPTPAAVRRYLAEFLSDPRIIELSRLVWLPLLHAAILPRRSRASAAKYASIWGDKGGVPAGISPLLHWTAEQARGVAARLGAEFVDPLASVPTQPIWPQPSPKPTNDPSGVCANQGPLVSYAMRYGQPAIARVLDAVCTAGAARVLIVPLYAQYSASTTASIWDAVCAWSCHQRLVPELRMVQNHATDAGYIAALAHSVRQHWAAQGRAPMLVMSFHGVPEAMRDAGDPYVDQCYATAHALAAQLGLNDTQWRVTFQSRFGPAEWVKPYTEPTVQQLAREGAQHIDVICPGFAADCIETLEEIDAEVREAFEHAGGVRFGRVPCLNASAPWLDALAALAQRQCAGWDF